ncbi:MAG: cadherin domain-containing protein, partial [Planctomycetota bacterium]
ALSNASIVENSAANSVVGSLSTTDPDANDTFTYTLVAGTGATDNAVFNISGNNLRATAALNFETNYSYSIRVRATDQGGLSFEKVFSVSVTNVSEAPTDISLSATSIAENAGVNAVVGTLLALDPDAGATLTYTLVDGAGGDDNSRFNISGSRLRANESLDFETKSSFTVRVRAVDQAGLSFEKPLTVAVRNVNEAPFALALSNTSLAENAGKDAQVGTLSATDLDTGDSVAFRFASGTGDTGNKQFKIQGNRLLAAASLNCELQPTYSVRLQAVDKGGLVVDKVFSISITDVNEAPRGLTLSQVTIQENAGVNAVVGALSTLNSDATDNFTYTLVAGAGDVDNAAFNMDGNQLRATASLDFESKSKYNVRIRTADKEGLFFERSFAVTVINVNDAPTNITLSKATIAENAGSNAAVGKLAAIDADKGNTFTYSLVAGSGDTDNSAFKIDKDQLLAASSLNFEAKSGYSVRLRATDQGGLSFDKVFSIAVTNVNEAPTALALSNATIVEGAGANALVGEFSATDPDAGETFSYSLVRGTGDTGNAAFTIAGNQLRAKASLNFATQSTYSVRVRAQDLAGLFFDRVFSISVSRATTAGASRVADRGEGEGGDGFATDTFFAGSSNSDGRNATPLQGVWSADRMVCSAVESKANPIVNARQRMRSAPSVVDDLFERWGDLP